jgi:predicted DNA-binding transcriptional regulator YafY
MFSQLEIEALVLGLSEVRHMGDAGLTRAAEVALSKIIATLPQRVQRQAAHAVSRSVKFNARSAAPAHIDLLRTAMWDERAVRLRYSDRAGSATTREIWPLAIVYFDNALMCLAHCQLRQDFRRFHLDKMQDVALTDISFRPRRVPMLRDYVTLVRGTVPAAAASGLEQ